MIKKIHILLTVTQSYIKKTTTEYNSLMRVFIFLHFQHTFCLLFSLLLCSICINNKVAHVHT